MSCAQPPTYAGSAQLLQEQHGPDQQEDFCAGFAGFEGTDWPSDTDTVDTSLNVHTSLEIEYSYASELKCER